MLPAFAAIQLPLRGEALCAGEAGALRFSPSAGVAPPDVARGGAALVAEEPEVLCRGCGQEARSWAAEGPSAGCRRTAWRLFKGAAVVALVFLLFLLGRGQPVGLKNGMKWSQAPVRARGGGPAQLVCLGWPTSRVTSPGALRRRGRRLPLHLPFVAETGDGGSILDGAAVQRMTVSPSCPHSGRDGGVGPPHGGPVEISLVKIRCDHFDF